VLDHAGPQSHKVLGRRRGAQSVGKAVPEKPFDPLVGGRAQVEYQMPEGARVFSRR
jgi:hypothetical protein